MTDLVEQLRADAHVPGVAPATAIIAAERIESLQTELVKLEKRREQFDAGYREWQEMKAELAKQKALTRSAERSLDAAENEAHNDIESLRAQLAEARAHPDPNNIWTRAADDARNVAEGRIGSLQAELAEARKFEQNENRIAGMLPEEYDGDEAQCAIIERFVRDALGWRDEIAEARAVIERMKDAVYAHKDNADGNLDSILEALDAAPSSAPEAEPSDGAVEALEAAIAQMEMTEKRMPEWKHPMTLEPQPPSDEFQRGYREGRYKVQHILGVMRSARAAVLRDTEGKNE